MVSAVKMNLNARTLASTNPGRGYAELGQVPVSDSEDIARAIKSARAAQPGWQALGVAGRVKAMHAVADAIDAAKDELAEMTAKEMGMPITSAHGTHAWSMNHMRWYLDHAAEYLAPEVTFEDANEIHKVVPEPYGLAAVIVPWNFPLSNFVMGAFQPLLAGNAVVFKASEEVPLFAQALEHVIAKAKLPQGVFNVVYGDGAVGEELTRGDIDLICFTGSSAVGKKLYKIAAEKFIPAHLELGGSDAGIVCEDADVQGMAEAIYEGKFSNCGQICCGLKRLLVHESKLDETIAALKKVIESKVQGDPLDPKTQLGPLAAERQLRLLQSQVEDARAKGATFVTGGASPKNLQGAYFAPTLVTNVKADMRIWNEEVFGPVLPIMSFKMDEQAIQMANDTQYGLSGYIFTSDRKRAETLASAMKCGSISHNGSDYSGPNNPFGGYKLSGIKRTGGKQGFRDACQFKTVCIKK